MSQTERRQVTEQESMAVAEASRQKKWKKPSFMKEMFLGNFRLDLIHPYPLGQSEAEWRPEFREFYDAMHRLLRDEVDSVEIDRTGEYPPAVLDRLRELGAFGMKIPKKYGGLGFTNREYQRIMHLIGSMDGNISALLSAHQSIGVPQPLKLFGSDELKQKYLPRCARGEISAFALTEPDVGSDPARMSTVARKTADGYVMDGIKLWCTNGTIADLLVVMAKDPDSGAISAFVVEADWPGVEVTHRCHFMGLRALANAVITFTGVKVPAENLIGREGRGLKIALTTLNDGRLSIPNGSVGAVKACIEICRRWTAERVQWGKPVGKHEAISHMLANMAATGFAAQAMVDMATAMADDGNFDIRLEAAASKEWVTCRTWEIVDDTMQIRGGRGYETEPSLAARGDLPIGVERLMRDYRINKIFEGSSEIMHLFMAREAVDKHLQVAGALIDPRQGAGAKLKALFSSAAFYLWWYPSRWLGWGRWPRFAGFGRQARHIRFVERSSRKLARQIFHGMVVHKAAMQRKQGFLFRVVDIANELFAMASAASRAHALAVAGSADAKKAGELSDVFCRGAARKVRRLFHELWRNDDARNYRAGVAVMNGEHAWFETGILTMEEAMSNGLLRQQREQQAAPAERRPARDAAPAEAEPEKVAVS